jgi:hypothetical protein
MLDSVNELSDLAAELNQESDSLNETVIASTNAKLAKLGLGVEAWVGNIEEGDPYFREDDENERWPLHTETWLGYYRFDRGWELAIKMVVRQKTGAFTGEADAEETVTGSTPLPLLNAPRDVRVKATELIPQLLDAIRDNAQELLKSIKKAKQAAKKL